MIKTKAIKSKEGKVATAGARSAHANFAATRKVLGEAVARGELSASEAQKAVGRLGASRKSSSVETSSRRDDILAAAAEIFASRGYHAATLQEIAGELSLTRPAFYHYFKSKQEILEAICVSTADSADDVISRESQQAGPNCEQTLRRTLLAYTVHIGNSATTTIMWRNFGEMSPAKQRTLIARRRAREQKVLDLIERGIKQGEFSTPEPRIATLTAFETINSLHNWFDNAGRLTIEQIANVLVDQVLLGILSRR